MTVLGLVSTPSESDKSNISERAEILQFNLLVIPFIILTTTLPSVLHTFIESRSRDLPE